jgi:hypothetical protein
MPMNVPVAVMEGIEGHLHGSSLEESHAQVHCVDCDLEPPGPPLLV